MALKILNRVGMYVSTTGTGSVTVDTLISNRFLTPVEAGAVNGDESYWLLEEGSDFEIFRGTYSSSGPTISRDTVIVSKIGGAAGTTKMTLLGNATLRSVSPDAAFISPDSYAPLASPALTGTPTAPTAAATTNTTQIATTAMVQAAVGSYLDTDTSLAANSDTKVATQKAVKTYIDGLAVNVGKRGRVRAATTANIVISTALNNADVIDGVTLATGDLVLVKNQSSAAENGVYVVGVTPARSSQYDSWDEFPGSLLGVAEGTVNGDTIWLCTSNAGGTLDTTAIAFTQLRIAGELLASDIGSTVQGYDAATAKTNQDQSWTGAQRSGTGTTLTSGTTITPTLADWEGNRAALTLAHNATLANPTDIASMVGYCGRIVGQQDGTGGRTLAYGSSWYPIGAATAPAAPTGANAKFRIDFEVVSSTRIDFALNKVGV